MHAYIFFNSKKLLPESESVLYYEEALTLSKRGGQRTQDGKVDFVFKTSDDKYLVVEVKHLPMDAGKSKRNDKRNKVLEQVRRNIRRLSMKEKIWTTKIKGVVITNDDQSSNRAEVEGYLGITIDDQTLNEWLEKQIQ